MSRTVVRYEGEGKARRPVYADHGPANGAGGGTLIGAHAQVAAIAQAEASRLVEVGGRMPDGGAGKIERSMATEAQRAAWRAADEAPARSSIEDIPTAVPWRAEPGSIAQTRAAQMHASRMRGGERNRQLVAAARHAPSPRPEKETVMAIEPEPVPIHLIITQLDALNAVQAALAEAIEIQSALDGARRAERELEASQERAYELLRAACRRAGLAEPLDVFAKPPVREPIALNEPLLEDVAIAAALRDDRLGDEPADDAPEVVTRPAQPASAAGGGPGRPAYVTRMLEAMVDAGGDFTVAADRLGIKRTSLVGTMSTLRARTDLTDAERAVVARKR